MTGRNRLEHKPCIWRMMLARSAARPATRPPVGRVLAMRARTLKLLRSGLFLLVVAGASSGFAQNGAEPASASAAAEADEGEKKPPTVCELIEGASRLHGVPVDFFTRLVWQESRFRPNAVSPKGAQGIAQFMPGTAKLRGLADPFDPHEAIPASAKYLAELTRRFGNQGLAAAAYNAGEQRLMDWLSDRSTLPLETRDYVLTITGRAADEWTRFDPNVFPNGVLPGPPVRRNCLETAALLARPGAGMASLEKVPRADWAPWGAQVAGNFSVDRALRSYALLQERHRAVIGGKRPMVVRTINRSRGQAPFFQVRVPAQSREEAAKLCQELRTSCVVFKN